MLKAFVGPQCRYRGTSPTRKRSPLGPYRRPVPRVPGGFLVGGFFLWARYPCSEARSAVQNAPCPGPSGIRGCASHISSTVHELHQHRCVGASRSSVRARCGAGSSFSAIRYQSLNLRDIGVEPCRNMQCGILFLHREPIYTSPRFPGGKCRVFSNKMHKLANGYPRNIFGSQVVVLIPEVASSLLPYTGPSLIRKRPPL